MPFTMARVRFFLMLGLLLASATLHPAFAETTPSLVINAVVSGAASDGDPVMGILVDGQLVGSSPVKAHRAKGEWETLDFAFSYSQTPKNIGVAFLNGGEDKANGREIYVQSVTVNGSDFYPEQGAYQAVTDAQATIGSVKIDKRGVLAWNTESLSIAKAVPAPATMAAQDAGTQDVSTDAGRNAAAASPASSSGGGGDTGGGGGGGGHGSGGGGGSASPAFSVPSGGSSGGNGVSSSSSSGGSTTSTTPAPTTSPSPATTPSTTNSDTESSVTAGANRIETFTGANGKKVTIEIDGPVPQSPVVTVSLDDASIVDAAIKAAGGNNDLVDYYLFYYALQKAQSTHASVLNIPARTYNLRQPTNHNVGWGTIHIVGLSDLTIEGNGSTLNFYSEKARAGIHISKDQRILLKNITMDWIPYLAYPATLSTDPQTKRPMLTIDPAYPIDAANPPPIRTVMWYDFPNRDNMASRKLTPAQLNVWNAEVTSGQFPYTCGPPPADPTLCFKPMGGQNFLFGTNEHLSPLPPTDTKVVATARNNNFGAIVIDGGNNISLEDVTIYNSPGAGIQALYAGKGLRLTRCVLTRKPDSLLAPGENPRLVSTMSDAFDAIATEGSILIENSEFAYQGDDGININGSLVLPHVIDSQTLSIAMSTPGFYLASDTVSLYHSSNLGAVALNQPLAEVTEQKNSGGTTMGYILKLANPIQGLSAMTDVMLGSDRMSSSNYIIRNTLFHDNRARGIIVHGANGLIESNNIWSTTGVGIQIMVDGRRAPAEGPPASNILVQNNTLSDTNTQWLPLLPLTLTFPAAINAFYVGADNYSASPAVQQIIIQHNIIKNVPGLGIYVSSADNVQVLNNQFTSTNLHDFGVPWMQATSMYVDHASNVTIQGNQHDSGNIINYDKTTTSNIIVK